MITKEDIIAVANKKSQYSNVHGGFVNTDGEWSMARTPEQFKSFLEKTFGFEVIECKATDYSMAIATTACGLCIAWDGFCYYKRKTTTKKSEQYLERLRDEKELWQRKLDELPGDTIDTNHPVYNMAKNAANKYAAAAHMMKLMKEEAETV